MEATPLNLNLPWRIISMIGIAISASSVLSIVLSLWLRQRAGLNPFNCVKFHRGYIVPHPLHTFLIGIVWVTVLLLFAHVRLYQYAETGDGRGLNLVLSQLYYASGSPVILSACIGFILATIEQDLRVFEAPTLTSDGVIDVKQIKIKWFETHLRSPLYTNSLFVFQWLIVVIQFPLLLLSDLELEAALTLRFSQPVLSDLYYNHLHKAERYFTAFYVCQTLVSIIAAAGFSYYIVQQRHSDAHSVYHIPALVAYTITGQACILGPLDVLFAADSSTFLVGSGPVSVKTAIVFVTMTSGFVLQILVVILYYSLRLLPENPRKKSLLRKKIWDSNFT